VALDHYPRKDSLASPNSLDGKPIVIVIPGVFGESGNHDVVVAAKYIYEQIGFRAVVFNRVGYSGVEYTGNRLSSFDCYPDFKRIVMEL